MINYFHLVTESPSVTFKDIVMNFRISSDIAFTDVLTQPLPFKIPIKDARYINQFPGIFKYSDTQYGHSIDAFLEYQLLSWTSQRAVIA